MWPRNGHSCLSCSWGKMPHSLLLPSLSECFLPALESADIKLQVPVAPGTIICQNKCLQSIREATHSNLVAASPAAWWARPPSGCYGWFPERCTPLPTVALPSFLQILEIQWGELGNNGEKCPTVQQGVSAGSWGKGQGTKEVTSCSFQYWKDPLRNERALQKGKNRASPSPAREGTRGCPEDFLSDLFHSSRLILIPEFSTFYSSQTLGYFNRGPYHQFQGPLSESVEGRS